jgi:hypothetical protein
MKVLNPIVKVIDPSAREVLCRALLALGFRREGLLPYESCRWPPIEDYPYIVVDRGDIFGAREFAIYRRTHLVNSPAAMISYIKRNNIRP